MGLKIVFQVIALWTRHVERGQTEAALRQSRLSPAITAQKPAALQTLKKKSGKEIEPMLVDGVILENGKTQPVVQLQETNPEEPA